MHHKTFYKSGDYPTIVLITDPIYSWLYTVFQRYANVIHVHEETLLSLPGRLRRLLVRAATKQSVRFVERLLLGLASTSIKLKHVHRRVAEEGSIDAVVVVQPAILPRKRIKDTVFVFWSFDSHIPRVLELHAALALEGYFDRIYATHSYAVRAFREKGVDARHLPYGVYTEVFQPRRVERLYKPVFVGSVTGRLRGEHVNRKLFLEKLGERLKRYGIELVIASAYQHDYSILIAKNFFVIDVPRRHEVNWRVFETTGTGALLFTEDTGEIREYFEPGEEIIVYRDAESLADAIAALHEDREEADRIAARGCTRAWREHTLDERVCRIIRDLGYKCRPRQHVLEYGLKRCTMEP